MVTPMSPAELQSEFDTIDYENGDYYEGEAVNRVPHGEGTMYYARGNKCSERSGYWLYGLPVSRAEPDSKIPGFSDKRYQSLIVVNSHTFCVGYGYDNSSIAEAFGVSTFIRGIRIHHEKAVLFSLDNTVYRDGIGWENDTDGESVFIYTGEGLEGDQEMSRGNLFINNSRDGGLYLFVKRRNNDYTFYGEVELKRKEEATEPDKNGNARKVFKFVLRRHSVE